MQAVLKQLEMVSAGQVRTPQNLLSFVFQFLALLVQVSSTTFLYTHLRANNLPCALCSVLSRMTGTSLT